LRSRSVDDSQLVSERDDFQVQRGAGPNHQPKRVGQRDDDTDDEVSLFETGGHLNPDNAYRVSDTHTIKWIAWVCWNKSFDTARSNQTADERAVATFAYRITLNMNGLRGNEHET
jgi:hypothetical protein